MAERTNDVRLRWPLPTRDYWSTPFAESLLQHLDLSPGVGILDIASGHGIPAFYLAEQVGPTGQILAIDLSEHQIARARAIAIKNGVRYAFTGNVHDEDGESTYCHACGQKLIGRNWYRLSDWNLTADGRCNRCGTVCAGVFEPMPGQWGDRRQPVRLRDFAA